jgi:hypothetical protein
MNNDFKALQDSWKSSKNNIKSPTNNFEALYKKIEQKEKENFSFYYGTIIILTITLIAVSLFFYYMAPVKETLSRIGAGLMITGLAFRILIEIGSVIKAKRINRLDKTLQTVDNTLNFHQFRKIIHQVYSPIIIGLYSIGFYIIFPEFRLYMNIGMVWFIGISYLIMGIVLFIVIRKGVVDEMRKLSDIMKLKKDIIE